METWAQHISLKLNGAENPLNVAPWAPLLDLLRESLPLTDIPPLDGERMSPARRLPASVSSREDGSSIQRPYEARSSARTRMASRCSFDKSS